MMLYDMMLHAMMLFVIYAYTARNFFWNPAGVEPVYWKQAHIDPGSRVSGKDRERTLVRI